MLMLCEYKFGASLFSVDLGLLALGLIRVWLSDRGRGSLPGQVPSDRMFTTGPPFRDVDRPRVWFSVGLGLLAWGLIQVWLSDSERGACLGRLSDQMLVKEPHWEVERLRVWCQMMAWASWHWG